MVFSKSMVNLCLSFFFNAKGAKYAKKKRNLCARLPSFPVLVFFKG